MYLHVILKTYKQFTEKKKTYAHDNKNRKVETYTEFFSSKVYLSVHV